MSKRKKILIISLPIAAHLLLRLGSQFISIESESVLLIPMLFILNVVVNCMYPVILVKYFRDIRYLRPLVVLLLLVVILATTIDLFIILMIRYEQTMLIQFQRSYEFASQYVRNVAILSHLIAIIVGIFAYIVIQDLKDSLSKIALHIIITIFMIYHIIDLSSLYGFHNNFFADIFYPNAYYFNVIIGSFIVLLGFREQSVRNDSFGDINF